MGIMQKKNRGKKKREETINNNNFTGICSYFYIYEDKWLLWNAITIYSSYLKILCDFTGLENDIK